MQLDGHITSVTGETDRKVDRRSDGQMTRQVEGSNRRTDG